MDKKELGLTNSDIVEIINNLDDKDFYDVMTEFNKKNITNKSLGEWIDMCMKEIETIYNIQ